MNQKNFKVTSVQFRVVTRPEVSNEGIELRITEPNGAQGVAVTDVNGVVSTEGPGLAGLAGKDPLGPWKIEVTDGASLMDGGVLKLDRVYNIQMGLEYSFEYVEEAI